MLLMSLFASFLHLCLYSQTYGSSAQKVSNPSFHWPSGKRAALSLSFDDARLSQADVGFALFQKYGVKATFYVSLDNLQKRLPAWKEAVKAGHEIGNHSLRHSCSGNFPWSRERALEDYTLDQMRQELLEANRQVDLLLGVAQLPSPILAGRNMLAGGIRPRARFPWWLRCFRQDAVSWTKGSMIRHMSIRLN